MTDWISTATLYVSDIQGANINISGITIDPAGIFNAPIVSLSTANFKAFDSLLDVDFSFDFGLGKAIGGVVGGLGAAVGGGLIAVGTGAGLAIQGAEQGIATMVAGRPENFISQTNYETINFTSQLQVSTLGNAAPAYSSIFRTVSSLSPNQVPGLEIFTSTIFYPNQICIRSVSDPFNLISGDSNLNTSTIQSFGQWVPLEGLEPSNINADTVSTNKLSTGEAYIELATIFDQQGTAASFSNVGIASNLSMNYDAPILFNTTSSNYGSISGNLGNMYLETNNAFIFTQYPTTTEGASLYIGSNANESLLNVSSIYSRGNIQAYSGYFSTLTAETLIVVSTINLTSTNVENITSTATIYADDIFAKFASISTMAPFTFGSNTLGNPTGTFDLNRYDSVVSTTYNSISSLQQNILQYSLNAQIQEQTSISPFSGAAPTFNITAQNVSQWASTMIICSPGADVTAQLAMAYSTNFITAGITGQFDLTVDMTQQAFGFGATQYVGSVPGQGVNQIIPYIPPTTGFLQTYRLTVSTNGIWGYQTPAPAPPVTSNNNTFSIYQEINDTFIKTTDRLHLVGGDILFDGPVGFSNLQVQTLNSQNAYVGNLSTYTINASNIIVNPLVGAYQTYYHKENISFNSNPQQVQPLYFNFQNDSPDFIPIYNIIAPFIGNNYFNSFNYTSWSNTMWNNNVAASLGVPYIYLGDFQPLTGTYSAFFYINNIQGYAIPIYTIGPTGSNLIGGATGNQYTRIGTLDGVNWTITSNVPNPQGNGGLFSNIFNLTQTTTQTAITTTQNLQIQAPLTTMRTQTFALFADQIRVNSHQYGTLPTSGLPSYPIGFENTVYQDNNMSFTQYGVTGVWYSDATNVVSNINKTTYYDGNSWFIQIIPSRFRFPNTAAVYGWDVQPTLIPVGGGGYAWGYNRYITVSPNPGNTGNNWNWIMAIPRNYCTFTS